MSNVIDLFDAGHVSTNATSVTSAQVSGTTYLFVANSGDNKVQVFSVASNGSLTQVDQVFDNATLALNKANSVTTAEIAGTTYLFVGSGGTEGIQVFSVAADGSLTDAGQVFDDATLALFGANSLTTAEIGGVTYLFAASFYESGVQVFSVGTDGSLTDAGQVFDDATLALRVASSVATAEIAGTTFLFVTGYYDHGVQVFSVGIDGSLTDAGQVFDNGTLALRRAFEVTTEEIGGRTYLFVASSSDDGVQVFSVGTDGSLTDAGQVFDDAMLALKRASDVKTVELNGTKYLIVVSRTDDGIQAFSVGEDGSLTEAGQILDDPTLGLHGARDANIAVVDGTTYLFVVGTSPEDGVQTLALQTTVPFDLALENVVNTEETSIQLGGSVASLSDGGHIITWTSYLQDGDGPGIYAQRYDSDGLPSGGEFLVNTTTVGEQSASDVIALHNGGFVVSWTSVDSDQTGVYFQIYDSAGQTVGQEQIANSTAISSQGFSVGLGLQNGADAGDFYLFWESEGQDGDRLGIYGQRFDEAGSKLGGEFLVNTTTSDIQRSPRAAELSDGSFVIVWESYDSDGSEWGSYGQRYAYDGSTLGGEFLINTTTFQDQMSPDVTALANGGFFVVFRSYSPPAAANTEIFGQEFDVDGNKVGSEILISTNPEFTQAEPVITDLPDGGFFVSWSNYGAQDGPDIIGQRFDHNAQAVGTIFTINQDSVGQQRLSEVATLDDGRVVVVWYGNDSNVTGVLARTLTFEYTDLINFINGTNTGEVLTGTAGVDIIDGLEGRDTIYGGIGDDTVDGGGAITVGSNDHLYGEAGNDTYLFDLNYSGAIIMGETGSTGANVVQFAAGVSRASIFVHATYSGPAANQRIVIDYNPSNTSGYPDRVFIDNWDTSASDFPVTTFFFANGDAPITGAEINALFLAGGGFIDPQPNIISGTNSGEVLTGTADVDIIDGLEGRDTIYGGAGDDTIDGGGAITVGSNDHLYGDAGNDTYVFELNYSGAIIMGETGTAGVNIVQFGAGISRDDINVLSSYSGPAVNQRIVIDYNPSNTSGYPDRVFIDNWDTSASDFPVTLFVFENGDVPVTGEEINQVFLNGGGSLNSGSVITGTSAAEVLIGTDGPDIITGAAGDDTLSGGIGVDTFVINSDDGQDTVTGFVIGQDLIDLGTTNVSYDDLSITQNGSDVVVSGFGIGIVILQGIDASHITSDIFLF